MNAPQGLTAADPIRRELMKTWPENYLQTQTKLRLPAAMRFIFNGLKSVTALVLIGASVAEVFGSPIRGMGFRISTEVGRLALDRGWAESLVAVLVGSTFYGVVAGCEGAVSFWYPSQRGV